MKRLLTPANGSREATPIRDVALCIELQQRAIHALMTRADWEREVDRLLDDWPIGLVSR